MAHEYSMKNSLYDVLRGAAPEISLFFPEALLQLVPEDLRDKPMEEWADMFIMPWGFPFPAHDLVEDANMIAHSEENWDIVPLWDPEHFTIDSNDIHSVCLMIPKSTLSGTCPAALICPGGGYENIAFHNEGLFTAKKLAQAGYRTFILNYRYSPNRYPAPQTDLAMAIKYLRANAADLLIDPDDLMILGYSAGGHLCASTVALRDELDSVLQKELLNNRPELAEKYSSISLCPDKVCLCYPVISFLEEDHEPSFQCLTGGDETLREHLSVEKNIDAAYPKTFVWTCADDSLVPPSNAARMADALAEKKIPHCYKLYPQGEHGCSIGTGTSAEGWIDELVQYMK